ncbi:patatin-like phospholipase family protein [Aquimarina sp. 2201CG14-23]|uniref:patatin-like phospholipase family protein n=1 Tax=Aquimarina mycalae TaxID=3040073 RepID=UPI002477EE38|nr:patatin-like phospholipase family protein [Aquimarina sp. 2201CG14-23]MDH7444162.1 patatin-like phospholipase family protein [Aquimarina sp. 2201CG14-23]
MKNLLLFFQGFNIWFKSLLRELTNNIISVFFIVAVYIALWHFPQTVDLLLILNQADTFLLEVPLYFGFLLVSAFLIWNVPKYFYFHNYKDISFSNLIGFIPNQHYNFQDRSVSVSYSYKTRIHMRKTLPRILAILLLTISALSILNAMELFGLENSYTKLLNPTNTLILIVFLLLLLSEPKLYRILRSFFNRSIKTPVFFFGISIGLILLMISLGSLNTQAEKDLGNLFLSNCALVLVFAILSFNSYNFLKKIPKNRFYGMILTSGFLILIGFLIMNIYPDLATRINPLSILIFSLLSLFMISFILILLGKKIKLPLLSIVVVFCVFSARFFSDSSTHYQLDLKQTNVDRQPLETYVYYWLKSREDIIKNRDKPFPVIMVSAEGGGSRAGLWSFLIHSYLYEKSNGSYFKENLLSLTGASGGSVGNAMFFAEAQNAVSNNTISNFKIDDNTEYPGLQYKASAIYKENYLSMALLSLLGRDLFKELTSLFSFKNRGQLLEEQWIKSHEKYFSSSDNKGMLDREFLSFYKNIPSKNNFEPNQQIPPLLLINTTHTQTGNYNIISPVTYSHVRPLAGMNDFLSHMQSIHPDKSIALSTAMRINASFPFITPVGEVRRNATTGEFQSDQYADAGYYDNIGGRVSKGIEEVLKMVLKDSFPNLKEKVKIKHMIITNEDDKIAKTNTQLAAPLVTLKNVRYGHTQEALKRLGDDCIIKLKQTKIIPPSSTLFLKDIDNEKLEIKPVLPLGRYLSTIAIRSIEARMDEVSEELDAILEIK